VTKSLTAYEPNYLFHHRLARRGYVVLDPDYRHSQGYGRKFRTDVYGYLGGKDLDDVVAGIDYLRDRGGIDPQRVGIYGGSYGGFLTLMALFTKSDRFAAGCALRSVTDWRTYNAWYTNPRLGDPTRDVSNYVRSSPIDHAKGLSKPLLLIHGLKDSNVFAQDTIRLVETLIELQKDDFEMMLYPSQDHGFSDADSWFDEYRRIERFFDRHLASVDGAH
jgi:dipeptidyl aminopeptidase/acylaminoacyl peptidase